MKVAVGSRPYEGPWGGGNRFVAALVGALKDAEHTVVYDLSDADIDIILLTDPRRRSPNVCIGAGEIVRYLSLRNQNAIVVHRVNECDERKNEPFINHKLVKANYVADATVFVGEWLVHLPVWRQHLRNPWFVIRNGSDSRIFNSMGFQPWSGDGPLKLVTHHWGYHRMKGFDVYSMIDRMLASAKWRDRISLTYIGNVPKDYSFKNARYLKPLDGAALAAELRSHHGYCTGSINEPGGNHQNEGALCGLPLLFRNSGCLPEYCEGFGVSFQGPADFIERLEQYLGEYRSLVQRMSEYPHTSAHMSAQWLSLFESLIKNRADLKGARRLWRDPWRAVASQLAW